MNWITLSKRSLIGREIYLSYQVELLGRTFFEEVTRLMKLWINDTPLRKIALKAVHVIPALLLQKPSKTSKSKDHYAVLE